MVTFNSTLVDGIFYFAISLILATFYRILFFKYQICLIFFISNEDEKFSDLPYLFFEDLTILNLLAEICFSNLLYLTCSLSALLIFTVNLLKHSNTLINKNNTVNVTNPVLVPTESA